MSNRLVRVVYAHPMGSGPAPVGTWPDVTEDPGRTD